MKKLHTTLLIAAALMCGTGLFAQTIFVKSDATGANNGTSWANAYTKLEPALTVAEPGQDIWVAAGTYRPDSTVNPVTRDFILQSGVNLWGGFAGTETALDQRNLLVNVTTLSGDLKGDDVAGNFTQNRKDNSLHILRVENGNPDDRSIVDGFRFVNGNTLTTSTDATQTRGAAILAVAKLTVRNCLFTGHFTNAGVVTANGPLSNGILVDRCVFDGNSAAASSAGVLMLTLASGEVNNSVFRNNLTNRGCVYPDNSTGIVVDSCLFENNKTTPGAQNFGSAMFTWQSSYAVSNCTFRGNEAYNALVYNDGRNGGKSGTWDNCLFENNKATNFGGGLYNWQANLTVRNCTFRNNTSPSGGSFFASGSNTSSYKIESSLFESNASTSFGGSAIYNTAGAKFEVRNCTFRGNTSTGSAAAIYNRGSVGTYYGCTVEENMAGYGGAIANYTGDKSTFDSCFFKLNVAEFGGGAMHTGFNSAVTVKRCVFQENKARVGAALGIQNDSTSLLVESCFFGANNAELIGGCIGGYTSGVKITVRSSILEANSADRGGAIHITEDSLNLSQLIAENTIFRENVVFGQGGAVNLQDADAQFTNCLFNGNLNLGNGAGGAISSNAAGGKTVDVTAINCTFSNNLSVIGAGIAQYEDVATSSKANLKLQNNIFSNEGDNYAIEEGAPTVTSLGGNLSDDETLAAYFTATNDLNSSDPLFVELETDQKLQATSPAINKGIAAGAPTKDITGANRVGLPDMGCYEFGTTIITEPLPTVLRLSPNPTADWVNAVIENTQNEPLVMEVVALGGQVARTLTTDAAADNSQIRISVADLPTGAYFLKIRAGNTRYIGGFVKH